MTRTLFISDLHLHHSRPEVTEAFLRFLDHEAVHANALYILGDLFEVWVGDDGPDEHDRRVVQALGQLTAGGCHCFITRGNRDFLLSDAFCRQTSATLLDEETLADVHGNRVLLMHGDQLCTDDREYQMFRRMVRNPGWQSVFLALPLAARRALAERIRERSERRTAGKSAYITDVNQEAVAAALRRHGNSTLLHGHTHRPGVHRFEVDGVPATRIVLGDWYEQGSVLTWTAAGFSHRTFSHRAAGNGQPRNQAAGRQSSNSLTD